ncbi:MAG TPA: DUF2203 domain-containing protein [Actinomycetota bacterium]|jgi:hypothetical protein|nr:DUF2203 domain-containing protein [Actinomycetota bacterium]
MARRVYTLDEANALLPYLAPTLVELREKFEEAAEIRAAIAGSAVGNGGSTSREKHQRTLARVAELMDRLKEWGIELRDISTGLIDFPAEIGGEKAFLCWRLGEPEVAFWHSPEDGFRGRRPL